MNPRRLRGLLLRWYRANRRDLPWRATRDPYAIWIAEVMLQQTRVATVLPYYRRFLERFPDAASLARADEEEVLALWSGLGYYRRARALHAAARLVVERHAGRLPVDPAELRRLPGIGRYTAGAIASTAFELAEPALDGNVRRVLARVAAVDGGSDERARLWALAACLVAGPAPGELNQALMELGALVCHPRQPACDRCPLRAHCRARAAGRIEDYPAPTVRAPAIAVEVAVALVRRGGAVLLERPGSDSPLRGAWDLPAVELEPGHSPEARLREALRHRHGLRVALDGPLGRLAHGIMNRRLRLHVVSARAQRDPAATARLRWQPLVRIDEVPISGVTKKALLLLTAATRVGAPAARADRLRPSPRGSDSAGP